MSTFDIHPHLETNSEPLQFRRKKRHVGPDDTKGLLDNFVNIFFSTCFVNGNRYTYLLLGRIFIYLFIIFGHLLNTIGLGIDLQKKKKGLDLESQLKKCAHNLIHVSHQLLPELMCRINHVSG